MSSTFTGIEMSKRALFAQQTALATTGHNVANANTKGYTRQVVTMQASRPLEFPAMTNSTAKGQLGQGVEVQNVGRVREKFLDDQFHNENKLLGEWGIKNDTLDKLETIMSEPSDTGIRQTMENFWNSWQELSTNPDSTAARASVKEYALAMTDAFNHTSKQLDDLSNDLTNNIDMKVTEANQLVSQIAGLNENIYRIEALGNNNANDLRDQRDQALDDLSKLINISYIETESGYTVQMGDQTLVSGKDVSAVLDSQTLQQAVSSGSLSGLSSGEIFGIIQSRDQYVASYQNQLDAMVKNLADGDMEVSLTQGMVIPKGTTLLVLDTTTNQWVNKTFDGTALEDRTLAVDTKVIVKGFNGLHQLGYGSGSPLVSGLNFFTNTSSAATLTVNSQIVNNINNIAASGRTYTDASGNELVTQGNNQMVLLLANLRSVKVDFSAGSGSNAALANGSLDEYYRAMVAQLGVESQEANRQATNQQTLVDQVDSNRQSVSGVSQDEEMSNMIMFQHAYNAAARMMTTFDECLDKVINSMGTVGR